jgi:hypothetical protein
VRAACNTHPIVLDMRLAAAVAEFAEEEGVICVLIRAESRRASSGDPDARGPRLSVGDTVRASHVGA